MRNNRLFVDLHVLQTVPPSCINRDDTGSPKTARFGGVVRARVSSQAWKKAIRDSFADELDENEIGQRTKLAAHSIAERIIAVDDTVSFEDATKLGIDVLNATGIKVNKEGETGYLLFISPRQIEKLARVAIQAHQTSTKIPAKEARSILNPKENPTLNAIDISLFGRMVANAPDLNVDAAVQVAHALGIGPSQTEFDYFTAMDDKSPKDSAGAGMIGTVEYLSATLYRYATIDVYHLYENLGSKLATRRAIEAFCRSFACSMPSGKSNTFANRTLPAAVLIQVRNTQPVSLVNAFESPVYAQGAMSQMGVAAQRLAQESKNIDEAFSTTPIHSFATIAASSCAPIADVANETGPLRDMVTSLGDSIDAYLTELGANDDSLS